MNSYYKEKLEQGLTYQDFVVEKLYEIGLPLISYSSKKYQALIGENKIGIEIKNDDKFAETGNFYIEIAEKSDANNLNWIPSGIYRNDNSWLYILGNYNEIYIFSKKQLILIHKTGKYREVEIPTSKGYLLPMDKAEKYWIKKIVCQ